MPVFSDPVELFTHLRLRACRTPDVSPSGEARLWWDSANSLLKVSLSGGAYVQPLTTDDATAGATTSTAAELTRAADVSTRSVAAGPTLAVTEAAHEGRTIRLDTAAGSVCTLPAPVVGARFRFLVTVKPTSNFHQIKVASASDFMGGTINILDLDAAAQGAFSGDGTADDNIQLNGTTKGGQIGDWIELEGISATQWAVSGNVVCPVASNPADMFSAAV